MEIKKLEAAVEAILFAMGDSVEVSRLAKAIEQDTETTRKLVRNLMLKYKVPSRNTMTVWCASPCSPRNRRSRM